MTVPSPLPCSSFSPSPIVEEEKKDEKGDHYDSTTPTIMLNAAESRLEKKWSFLKQQQQQELEARSESRDTAKEKAGTTITSTTGENDTRQIINGNGGGSGTTPAGTMADKDGSAAIPQTKNQEGKKPTMKQRGNNRNLEGALLRFLLLDVPVVLLLCVHYGFQWADYVHVTYLQ